MGLGCDVRGVAACCKEANGLPLNLSGERQLRAYAAEIVLVLAAGTAQAQSLRIAAGLRLFLRAIMTALTYMFDSQQPKVFLG
jgi:hypothetical protein